MSFLVFSSYVLQAIINLHGYVLLVSGMTVGQTSVLPCLQFLHTASNHNLHASWLCSVGEWYGRAYCCLSELWSKSKLVQTTTVQKQKQVKKTLMGKSQCNSYHSCACIGKQTRRVLDQSKNRHLYIYLTVVP